MTDDRRRRSTFLVLGVLLPLALLAGTTAGSVALPPGAVLASIARALGLAASAPSPLGPAGEAILWSVRLPRVLLAALVGGGLAVVGAALQSVFRNPMADASLLGVSSGAALGAVFAVKVGWASQLFLALPMSALTGALATMLVVYALAHV